MASSNLGAKAAEEVRVDRTTVHRWGKHQGATYIYIYIASMNARTQTPWIER